MLPRRRIALGYALAAHVLLIWGALQARGRWFPPDEAPAAPIFVLPINVLPPEIAPSPPPQASATPSARIRTVVTEPLELPVPQPAPDRVADAVPPTDWHRQMEQVVRSLSEADAAAGKNRLDSEPEVLQMPEKRDSGPKRGDVHALQGGGMRVFMNDEGLFCDFRQPLLMNQFETWAQKVPPSCGKRRAAGPEFNLDALKPDYLRAPLPSPGR
jgi:hypothetical protein